MANIPAVSQHSSRVPAASEHRDWIAGAVSVLLAFYWQDREPDDLVLVEQGRLWCDDLQPFTRPVIEHALTTWRRTQTRRPSPADIITLCRKHMPRPTAVAQLEAPERRTTPEDRERIQAMVAETFPELRRMPREGDQR
jgi:hypothetical protein